jgi:hypothetical protein
VGAGARGCRYEGGPECITTPAPLEPESLDMRATKQRGARAPQREFTRATLRLDAEVYRRLLVHSVMENKPAGEIATEALAAFLKGWSMPGKLTARAMSPESASGSGPVEEMHAEAA